MNWFRLAEDWAHDDSTAGNIGAAIGMILGLVMIGFTIYVMCM